MKVTERINNIEELNVMNRTVNTQRFYKVYFASEKILSEDSSRRFTKELKSKLSVAYFIVLVSLLSVLVLG